MVVKLHPFASCKNGTPIPISYARPFHNASDAAFEFTNHFDNSVSFVNGGLDARFTRPVNHFGYGPANPGLRIRFDTDDPAPRIYFRWNTRIPGAPPASSVQAAVFVDGVFNQYTAEPYPAVETAYDKVVMVGVTKSASRQTIMIQWPHFWGVDFLGVDIGSSYSLFAPAVSFASRKKVLFHGDSITQGTATGPEKDWTVLIGDALSCQIENLGFSGAKQDSTDGIAIAAESADCIVSMIGVNDAYNATDLTTFYNSDRDFWLNVKTTHSGIPLYTITPTWQGNIPESTVENYRQKRRDVATALGGITVIEGPTLIFNDPVCFFDKLHPNDTGCSQMASNTAPLLHF